jgi:hypothetical protein
MAYQHETDREFFARRKANQIDIALNRAQGGVANIPAYKLNSDLIPDILAFYEERGQPIQISREGDTYQVSLLHDDPPQVAPQTSDPDQVSPQTGTSPQTSDPQETTPPSIPQTRRVARLIGRVMEYGYTEREVQGMIVQGASVKGLSGELSESDVKSLLAGRLHKDFGRPIKLATEPGEDPRYLPRWMQRETPAAKQARLRQSKQDDYTEGPFEGSRKRPKDWQEGYISRPAQENFFPAKTVIETWSGTPGSQPGQTIRTEQDISTYKGMRKFVKDIQRAGVYAQPAEVTASGVMAGPRNVSPRALREHGARAIRRIRRTPGKRVTISHKAPARYGKGSRRHDTGFSMPGTFLLEEWLPEGAMYVPKQAGIETRARMTTKIKLPRGFDLGEEDIRTYDPDTGRGEWAAGQNVVPFAGAKPMDLKLGSHFDYAKLLDAKIIRGEGQGDEVELVFERGGSLHGGTKAMKSFWGKYMIHEADTSKMLPDREGHRPGFVSELKRPSFLASSWWSAQPRSKWAKVISARRDMTAEQAQQKLAAGDLTWQDVGQELTQHFIENELPGMMTKGRIRLTLGQEEYDQLPQDKMDRVSVIKDLGGGNRVIEISDVPMIEANKGVFMQMRRENRVKSPKLGYRDWQRLRGVAPKFAERIWEETKEGRAPYKALIQTHAVNAGQGRFPEGVQPATLDRGLAREIVVKGRELAAERVEGDEIPPSMLQRGVLDAAASVVGDKPLSLGKGGHLIAPKHMRHFGSSEIRGYERSEFGRAYADAILAKSGLGDKPFRETGQRALSLQSDIALSKERGKYKAVKKAHQVRHPRMYGAAAYAEPLLRPNEVMLPEMEVAKRYGFVKEGELTREGQRFVEKWKRGEVEPGGIVWGQPIPEREILGKRMRLVHPETVRERAGEMGMALGPSAGFALSETLARALGRDFDADLLWSLVTGQYKGGEITHPEEIGQASIEDVMGWAEKRIMHGRSMLRRGTGLKAPPNWSGTKTEWDKLPWTQQVAEVFRPENLSELGPGELEKAMKYGNMLRGRTGQYYNIVQDIKAQAGNEKQQAAARTLAEMVHGRVQTPEPLPSGLSEFMATLATGGQYGRRLKSAKAQMEAGLPEKGEWEKVSPLSFPGGPESSLQGIVHNLVTADVTSGLPEKLRSKTQERWDRTVADLALSNMEREGALSFIQEYRGEGDQGKMLMSIGKTAEQVKQWYKETPIGRTYLGYAAGRSGGEEFLAQLEDREMRDLARRVQRQQKGLRVLASSNERGPFVPGRIAENNQPVVLTKEEAESLLRGDRAEEDAKRARFAGGVAALASSREMATGDWDDPEYKQARIEAARRNEREYRRRKLAPDPSLEKKTGRLIPGFDLDEYEVVPREKRPRWFNEIEPRIKHTGIPAIVRAEDKPYEKGVAGWTKKGFIPWTYVVTGREERAMQKTALHEVGHHYYWRHPEYRAMVRRGLESGDISVSGKRIYKNYKDQILRAKREGGVEAARAVYQRYGEQEAAAELFGQLGVVKRPHLLEHIPSGSYGFRASGRGPAAQIAQKALGLLASSRERGGNWVEATIAETGQKALMTGAEARAVLQGRIGEANERRLRGLHTSVGPTPKHVDITQEEAAALIRGDRAEDMSVPVLASEEESEWEGDTPPPPSNFPAGPPESSPRQGAEPGPSENWVPGLRAAWGPGPGAPTQRWSERRASTQRGGRAPTQRSSEQEAFAQQQGFEEGATKFTGVEPPAAIYTTSDLPPSGPPPSGGGKDRGGGGNRGGEGSKPDRFSPNKHRINRQIAFLKANREDIESYIKALYRGQPLTQSQLETLSDAAAARNTLSGVMRTPSATNVTQRGAIIELLGGKVDDKVFQGDPALHRLKSSEVRLDIAEGLEKVKKAPYQAKRDAFQRIRTGLESDEGGLALPPHEAMAELSNLGYSMTSARGYVEWMEGGEPTSAQQQRMAMEMGLTDIVTTETNETNQLTGGERWSYLRQLNRQDRLGELGLTPQKTTRLGGVLDQGGGYSASSLLGAGFDQTTVQAIEEKLAAPLDEAAENTAAFGEALDQTSKKLGGFQEGVDRITKRLRRGGFVSPAKQGAAEATAQQYEGVIQAARQEGVWGNLSNAQRARVASMESTVQGFREAQVQSQLAQVGGQMKGGWLREGLFGGRGDDMAEYLTKYWNLFRMQRLWQAGAGATIKARAPAAQEQRIAMRSAYQAMGGRGIPARGQMATDLLTYQAQRHEMRKTMGATSLQAYGGIGGSKAMGFLRGIGGHALSGGTIAGLAIPELASMLGIAKGLSFTGVGLPVAGAIAAYGTQRALRKRFDADTPAGQRRLYEQWKPLEDKGLLEGFFGGGFGLGLSAYYGGQEGFGDLLNVFDFKEDVLTARKGMEEWRRSQQKDLKDMRPGYASETLLEYSRGLTEEGGPLAGMKPEAIAPIAGQYMQYAGDLGRPEDIPEQDVLYMARTGQEPQQFVQQAQQMNLPTGAWRDLLKESRKSGPAYRRATNRYGDWRNIMARHETPMETFQALTPTTTKGPWAPVVVPAERGRLSTAEKSAGGMWRRAEDIAAQMGFEMESAVEMTPNGATIGVGEQGASRMLGWRRAQLSGMQRLGLSGEQMAAMPTPQTQLQSTMMQGILTGDQRWMSRAGRMTDTPGIITREQGTGLRIGTTQAGFMGTLMNRPGLGLRDGETMEQSISRLSAGQVSIDVDSGGRVNIGGREVAFTKWGLQGEKLRQWKAEQERRLSKQEDKWDEYADYRLKMLDFQEEGIDMRDRQFKERWGLNWTQRMTQMGWQGQDIGQRWERQQVQFGWQRQDLAFQGNQQALNYAWNMEDIQENLRYATGRQRRQLLKRQDRATIRYAMQMGRLETRGNRVDQREQWGREDFEKAKRRHQQRVQWAQREMLMSRRHHRENMDLQRRRLAAQRDYWEKQRSWREEELKHARQMYEWNKQIREAEIGLGQARMAHISQAQEALMPGGSLRQALNDFLTHVQQQVNALEAGVNLQLQGQIASGPIGPYGGGPGS